MSSIEDLVCHTFVLYSIECLCLKTAQNITFSSLTLIPVGLYELANVRSLAGLGILVTSDAFQFRRKITVDSNSMTILPVLLSIPEAFSGWFSAKTDY